MAVALLGLLKWPDVLSAVCVIGMDSHVMDLEAQAARKAQDKQKLAFLVKEADDERAKLLNDNKECVICRVFLKRVVVSLCLIGWICVGAACSASSLRTL